MFIFDKKNELSVDPSLTIFKTVNSRYIVGPSPVIVCRFNYFLKLTLTVQGLMFMNSIIISRYIFIFWLKNPAAFQDEFWSLLVNIWVVLFSFISQIVFDVMLGIDSIHIHICTVGQ
jgi:hypothetical protein